MNIYPDCGDLSDEVKKQHSLLGHSKVTQVLLINNSCWSLFYQHQVGEQCMPYTRVDFEVRERVKVRYYIIVIFSFK